MVSNKAGGVILDKSNPLAAILTLCKNFRLRWNGQTVKKLLFISLCKLFTKMKLPFFN
jgi:hypothetical protein